MATYTPNLNLKKPLTGENYDITSVHNDAMDKIDLETGVIHTLIDEVKTKADAMISGSPKGVYATLATLQAAYPAGNGNIYVVSGDGKWYYWSGSAWTAGGTYQSTGIGDSTIDVNKTTFLRKSRNRVNPLASRVGFGFDTVGTERVAENSIMTDYIPVTPGETIYQGNNWEGYFYDSGKVKLATRKEFGSANFVVITGAAFYRTTYNNNNGITTGFFVSPVNLNEEYGRVFFTDDFVKNAIAGASTGSSLVGKKWAVLGDSITEVNTTAAKRYFDYIGDETPLNVVNMGVGGTGFMRGYDTTNAYYQRISSIPLDVDFLTIYGSGNDIALFGNLGNYNDSGTTTICGCVNKTLDNFFALCPATPVGIIAPAPWSYNPTTTPGNPMEQYVEKLRQIAAYRGVPFLDLYHNSNLRPEVGASAVLTFDGAVLNGSTGAVHPNSLGHKIIYPKIREFIKTLV